MDHPLARLTALAAACMCAVVGAAARAGDDLPAANSPDEPFAEHVSLARAASFLDQVAVDWTRKRNCGTCHTNYAYLLARPTLAGAKSEAMAEVRAFFEGRVASWDNDDDNARPRWDTEVVATAATLAIHDARTSGKLSPLSRRALDRMWTLQKPDGSWTWLKCDWPPYEHDDYYGAVFAALGVGLAPDGYRHGPGAQAGLAKLRNYLRTTPPPSLHHRAFLLWASLQLDGLMDAPQRQATMSALLAVQRPDGGWNLPSLGDWKRRDGSANDPHSPADGYGTGLVVYVLRQVGLPAGDPALRRGRAWLQTHQRTSGRWFTRSLNHDKAHYITHAGTAYAMLALTACEDADAR
jgi:squalene-hopene/tetraprenyl-beta-curcumene cyclase